ncbi:hypothetical protein GCK32_002658, partial [Trichostrongylus colubriformis]
VPVCGRTSERYSLRRTIVPKNRFDIEGWYEFRRENEVSTRRPELLNIGQMPKNLKKSIIPESDFEMEEGLNSLRPEMESAGPRFPIDNLSE